MPKFEYMTDQIILLLTKIILITFATTLYPEVSNTKNVDV